MTMTETTSADSAVIESTEATPEITAETVTDKEIDQFFDNGGKFKTEKKVKKEAKKVEEAPEEEKAEEAVEEPAEEKKADPKEDKKVNYGALHEERQRRKAEAARAAKAETELAEFKAKYQQPQQEQSQYQPQNPLEVIALRQQQIDQYLTQQEQQRQAQVQDAEFRQKYSQSAEAFKQDAPDFGEAYNFLVNSRLQELSAIGYTPEQAQQVLVDDERGIVNLAYQNEVNPAERIYNLAKMRGYAAKQTEVPQDNTEIEAKLDTIIKGQMANKNLPPASRSVNKDLTAAQLADMNVSVMGDSDFDSAWNKLFGRA